jgi:hypothetical protein
MEKKINHKLRGSPNEEQRKFGFKDTQRDRERQRDRETELTGSLELMIDGLAMPE